MDHFPGGLRGWKTVTGPGAPNNLLIDNVSLSKRDSAGRVDEWRRGGDRQHAVKSRPGNLGRRRLFGNKTEQNKNPAKKLWKWKEKKFRSLKSRTPYCGYGIVLWARCVGNIIIIIIVRSWTNNQIEACDLDETQ